MLGEQLEYPLGPTHRVLICFGKVLGVQAIVILADPSQGCHLRVLRSGGIHPITGTGSIEIVSLARDALLDFRSDPHDSQMRAEGLVRAIDIHIGAQLVDVDDPVRRVGHTIGHGDRPDAMGNVGDRPRVLKCADDIRTQAETNEAGARRDQFRQIVDAQLTTLWIDLPPPNDGSGITQAFPASDIGLMILVRHDHFVTWFQLRAKGLRQHVAVQ
jgi:hypothetical protein